MKKEKPTQQEAFMPISKMSYSGLAQLLRNPLLFKLKYILGVYDGKMGVAGMVGQAGHKALRYYYGGDPDNQPPENKDEARANAIQIGLDYLDSYNDSYIDYGKSSRAVMLEKYNQAIRFYFEEEPEYNEIIFCEEKLQGEIRTVDGDILPLPAVGTPDLIHKRADGQIEIIDTKFTSSFTDHEKEDYIKIVQAQFYWHLLREVHNITADRMLFREIKITKNMKENLGMPQLRDWSIPFSHEPYRVIFYNLYKDAVKFLSNPDAVYLPNLDDKFNAEETGLLYSQGLLTADLSDIEVMHKVKDLAIVSKKFVSSRLDNIENQHLNPEEKIAIRLAEFGIPLVPVEPIVGASITLYKFRVSRGVKMSQIEKHEADIARAIEAKSSIRILAPIPGTDLVGVEVPNETRKPVLLDKNVFIKHSLALPIGADIYGKTHHLLLDEAPHLLIAGATGSGKSMLLHSILVTLTKQNTPEEMELILIDPKRVELVAFAKAKHLQRPIIYNFEEAIDTLKEVTQEMERRYELLEEQGCRNITEYNKIFINWKKKATKGMSPLTKIVVVIDEFADLILQSKVKERKQKKKTDITAEEIIAKLAAMARAVGIHLIIATQRPSVDVITGLIKANFPTRIALTTSSPVDSRIILGEEGAEQLNGKGDLLLSTPSNHGLVRLQGFLVE